MNVDETKEVKEGETITENNKTVKKDSPSILPQTTENTKLTKEELKTLDYTDFSTPARMLELGEVLCKSTLVPLNKAEDVVTALMTGKELGLPFITSVSQIYPINGRPTLGVHIQKALLLQNKVIFEKIEDAVAIYQFVKADENGNVIFKEGKDGNGNVIKIPIIIGNGTINEQPNNTVKKEITKRTTYTFKRQIKMPNGEYETINAKSSFTLQEAFEAELLDKDVWKKYWRRMLDARAFTIGAREIADDYLLGIVAPNELDSNFYVNESGEEIHQATIIKN